jgi:hypothetical protein
VNTSSLLDAYRQGVSKREREEAQHRQFLAVRKSFRYFCENFVWIIDKYGRRCLLEWNDVQEAFMAKYTGMDMVLKARKMGFTTIKTARIYWRNQFQEKPRGQSGHRGVGNLVTHDADTTRDLFQDKLMYLHNGLPDWLRPPTIYSSKMELAFRGGGRIRPLTAGNRDIGRGQDLRDVHLAEWALYPNLKAIFSGIVQAMDGIDDAECTLESTARKDRPEARKYWDKCLAGNLRPYRAHFFGWSAHKDYRDRGQVWLRQKKDQLGDDFTQEFPETAEEAWRLSGVCRFSQKGIDAIRDHARPPVAIPAKLEHIEDAVVALHGNADDDSKERREYGLEVYEAPYGGGDNGKEPARYIVTVDSCEGIVSEETCWAYINVLRWDTCNCVARLRAQIPPGDTGLYAVEIAYFYNRALLAPEINNHGHATVLRIKDLQYENLYYHRDPFAKPRRRTKPGTRIRTRKAGWSTDARTRPLMLAQLARHIREASIEINDPVALGELETFLPGDKAADGAWDDSVIALAIGVYIRVSTTEFVSQPRPGGVRPRPQPQESGEVKPNRIPDIQRQRARAARF